MYTICGIVTRLDANRHQYKIRFARIDADAWKVWMRPILLKNSVSVDARKILVLIGLEARIRLGVHRVKPISRCRPYMLLQQRTCCPTLEKSRPWPKIATDAISSFSTELARSRRWPGSRNCPNADIVPDVARKSVRTSAPSRRPRARGLGYRGGSVAIRASGQAAGSSANGGRGGLGFMVHYPRHEHNICVKARTGQGFR